MINAFVINDSRLVRIDEDQTDLNTAIWLIYLSQQAKNVKYYKKA